MNRIKFLSFTLALIGLSGSLRAQNLNGAYFLDGYTYGHELNPAKDYDRQSYFSVPLLPGNLNVGLHGNLSLRDIFRKNPGGSGLVTYLHPGFTYDEAMKGFKNNNKLTEDLRFDLVSVGFHALKGFNTITIGLREQVGVRVPKEMFSMTRSLQQRDYHVTDVCAQAQAWMEVALGHSHQVTDAVRIGAKVKLLLGMGYARVNVDDLNLNLSGEDQWTAQAHATAEVGLKGFTWGESETKRYKSPERQGQTYQQINFNNMDLDTKKLGLTGAGMAVDLGAEWDLGKQEMVDGLKLSAALLDLGFIHWNGVSTAANRGEEFIFDGYNNIKVEDGDGTSFSDQSKILGDRLSDLYSLQDQGKASKTHGIGTTLNVGVEYALPAYDKLSFGLLSTTRIQGAYSWNEERLSANVSPCKWFELGANAGVGTLGASVGWVINLHPCGFNLFLGSDRQIGKLSKQGIPLRSNADFTVGINFPLGRSTSDK